MKKYTMNGKEYTIKELAELSGIKIATIRARIDRRPETPIEDLVFNFKRKNQTITENKKYTMNGKEYTIKELAELAKVSPDTMRVRIKRRPETPIEDLVFNFKRKNYTGIDYPDRKSYQKAYQLKRRLSKLKPECTTFYDKYGTKVLKKDTKVIIDDELMTLHEVAEKFNVKYTTLRDRIMDNPELSVKEAALLDRSVYDKRKFKRKGFERDPYVTVNKNRVHIHDAAKELGLSINTIYRYKRRLGDIDLAEVNGGTYKVPTNSCKIIDKK